MTVVVHSRIRSSMHVAELWLRSVALEPLKGPFKGSFKGSIRVLYISSRILIVRTPEAWSNHVPTTSLPRAISPAVAQVTPHSPTSDEPDTLRKLNQAADFERRGICGQRPRDSDVDPV